MAKGKKRAEQLKAKKVAKRQQVKAGAPSKYASKLGQKMQGDLPETSPFYFDPSNPEHKTVEQARREEIERFKHNRYVPPPADSSY